MASPVLMLIACVMKPTAVMAAVRLNTEHVDDVLPIIAASTGMVAMDRLSIWLVLPKTAEARSYSVGGGRRASMEDREELGAIEKGEGGESSVAVIALT